MKRHLLIIVLMFFLIETLPANTYRWDLVNAIAKNDFPKIETILKENIGTMSPHDKMLVMNFAVNYSYGENTLIILDMVKNYGIAPNSFNLYTAINRNQPNAVIQLMMQNGASPNGEILLLTMEKQRFDLAKQFIQAGINVNYQYPSTRNYADGMTPLLYASKWNNLELVTLLVIHGANVNTRATDGNTALSLAKTNGNDPMCNFLKEHGALETETNTPLQGAGITGPSGNQTNELQRGTYQLLGSAAYIRFTGSGNSGNINYVSNGVVNNGLYRIGTNNMTLVMGDQVFLYRIDTNVSFSGNGEVWIRIGN